MKSFYPLAITAHDANSAINNRPEFAYRIITG